MRNAIFKEIRANKMTAGYIWRFQQYYGAFAAHMNSTEKREFLSVMQELCREGIFEVVPYGDVHNYRLTEEGERVIYFC